MSKGGLQGRIETVLATAVTDIAPLSGGCVGQVYRVQLADKRTIVAKFDESEQPQLNIEGYMLEYLADKCDLPLPAVYHSEPGLLLLDFVPGDSHFSASAQHHAAELLAALHNVSAPTYGLERDTLIGGLHQPNTPNHSWLDFFREQRLRYMADEGVRSGRLPAEVQRRIHHFADNIERWLVEPVRPSLIHGDVWTTNVLARGGHITAFLDPAIYYADPEIELAFITLFGTFDEPFFTRYQTLRPLRPGFFTERRDIYNLYPLLVHVRLFGGSYVSGVDRVLRSFGY